MYKVIDEFKDKVVTRNVASMGGTKIVLDFSKNYNQSILEHWSHFDEFFDIIVEEDVEVLPEPKKIIKYKGIKK